MNGIEFYEEVGRIPIYHKNEAVKLNLKDFMEMPYYAIDAYDYDVKTGKMTLEGFDYSQDARKLAVRTVARHFSISEQEAIRVFDICVVPAFGFHGKILARRR